MISQGITVVLTSIIANRFLMNRKGKLIQKYMQQRWLRAPCAIGMGSFSAYLLNLGVMRTVYLNDLKDMKLD